MNNNINLGQPNNFNPNMNQPNNNFNNNQMMNQNAQNKNIDVNVIKNICANNLSKDHSPREMSQDLKKQCGGEWIVAITDNNDNFEFKISDAPDNNITMFQFGQKNIYICKYV